jgi:hypothetical protein
MLVHHGRQAEPAPFAPDKVFLAAYRRRAERALDPSPITRFAARLRHRGLDQALIAGADPASSRQLAARTAQLTARSTRGEIADGIERLVSAADGPPSRRRVIPSRGAVHANAAELHELAALLREPGPLYARGVAMVRELLIDGTGPAYNDRHGAALARQIRDARVAIGG